MVSSILSEDEKVNSSITDICSPDTTYLDLMIMYAAKRKGKQKSFKLKYVNDMKWKGDTKPVILKSGNLLSEDKQKQYSDMY